MDFSRCDCRIKVQNKVVEVAIMVYERQWTMRDVVSTPLGAHALRDHLFPVLEFGKPLIRHASSELGESLNLRLIDVSRSTVAFDVVTAD